MVIVSDGSGGRMTHYYNDIRQRDFLGFFNHNKKNVCIAEYVYLFYGMTIFLGYKTSAFPSVPENQQPCTGLLPNHTRACTSMMGVYSNWYKPM